MGINAEAQRPKMPCSRRSGLVRLDPQAERVERLVLPEAFALLEKLGENRSRKKGKGQAGWRGYVLVASQVEDLHRLPVIAPDLGHTQGSVDRELCEGLVAEVDLDHDVRRGINAEVQALSNDGRGVLHVKALIRLRPLESGLPFESRPSARLELPSELSRQNASQVGDGVRERLMFCQRSHDLQSALVVTHTQPGSVSERRQQPLIFLPAHLMGNECRPFR